MIIISIRADPDAEGVLDILAKIFDPDVEREIQQARLAVMARAIRDTFANAPSPWTDLARSVIRRRARRK